MSVFFDSNHRCFYLSGGNTSYILHVDNAGRLLNLHWGARVPDASYAPDLSGYPDFASFDPRESTLPHELPTSGTGYFGLPAVSTLTAAGNNVTVLRYVSHRITPGKPALPGLPATYVESDSEADTLELLLRDALTGLEVTVLYSVFAATGIITRALLLKNTGNEPIRLTGLFSASAPLQGNGYDVIHLKGAWSRERQIIRTPVGEGEYRFGSRRGASSHEENPFIALCEPGTTEQYGNVWALSFVYSGSFLACANVDNAENSRLSIGLQPDCFSWTLESGDTFTSPEAVMVWSDKGLGGMSSLYHDLYRRRLVRGVWRDRVRPILLNNWEATYFGFNEEKLLAIATKAREIGVELFVLDDGWFGKRDQDNCSLGDWVPDRKKLPSGLKALVDRVHALDMKFGLWFEPEMVSPDSDLYRAHPDWCLHVDGRPRTEARQQLILDLSRTEVQDYIISAISTVLADAGVDYVKWDMNRNMTEGFSGAAAPDRQMETQHRYILGLYRVLETIRSRFPEVLFEACSGGGGRFDPGMLFYMPQVWTSDNTDAISRLKIQYGTSMVYPSSAMGAHVSAVPNHQNGRITDIQTRCDVALGGNFGFELDLATLTPDELKTAAAMVQRVKEVRELTQKGIFSRLLSPFEGEYTAWQFTAQDRSDALLCVYRTLVTSATPPVLVRMRELDPDALYRVEDGQTYSGAVLMNIGIRVSLRRDFTSKTIRFTRV